ncbi:MAG: Gldg family protein, partial [Planctomycetes bacterium]|nr:Gldg family protein [Planctomycetota bacterium]
NVKDLSEKTQYAIDQFVMTGKNVIFFVDPFYMKDQQMANRMQPPSSNTSLDKLFSKWGVEYAADKVTLDPTIAYKQRTQQGTTLMPAVLTLNADCAEDDITTSTLNNLMMLYPGSVALKEGTEGIECTPLLSTTDDAQVQDKFRVMYSQPGKMMADLDKTSGSKKMLAAYFSGSFKSAFDKAPEGVSGEHKSVVDGKGNIIVVSDMDMLEDQYCLRPIQFIQGQILGYQALNQNTVFLNNIVEKMTGNNDLISLRSRGRSQRPFTKVAELEAAARKKFQAKEEELQKKLADVEKQINDRLSQADPTQQVVVSDVIQEQIKEFQSKKLKVSKELRKVRHDLRGSIDDLGMWLQGVNILLIPLLIALFGIFQALSRSRRVGS